MVEFTDHSNKINKLSALIQLIEYQLKPYSVRWAIDAHKNMYAEPDMTYILMTMVRRASRGRTAKKLIFT